MNWCDANGVSLHYQHRPGAGATLVLLHEMGGRLQSWDGVWDRLPGHIPVLRYDTRGAGLSEKPTGPLSIDDHVADLRTLLNELQIDGPLVLAGNAVGAAIALRFAAMHAGCVDQVIGFAPACGVAEAARPGVRACAQRVRQEGVRAAFLPLLDAAWPEVARRDSQVFQRYCRSVLAGNPDSLAATLDMLVDLELDADIISLTAKTFLVGGIYDGLRPPAEIERLAALRSSIETSILETGHFPLIEAPSEVANIIVSRL